MLKFLHFKSKLRTLLSRDQQKQNGSILCIDSQYIHKHDCFPRFPAGDWVFLADTTVLFELCRITSDSFLQAYFRFLSQAHLHVQLNIRMVYSPGLIHTAVSLNHEVRNSSLRLCCCSSPQNLCAFLCCALSQIRQRRFVLPYVDAVISTTCCCMLHWLKNPSISHSLSLCFSLDFLFFSSLFLVRASLYFFVLWRLDQIGNMGCIWGRICQ